MNWPSLCLGDFVFSCILKIIYTNWLQLWCCGNISPLFLGLVDSLPSYEPIMPAVLKVLAESATRYLHEVFERVCQHYALTPGHLAACLLSPSLVYWAAGRLVSTGGLYAVAAYSVEYGPASSETDLQTAETKMLMLV
ncbi:hypothetical protein [Aeromonas hydrophila]|uniref:hypothetical protein n=1 Tax=Aeromonas hydrophila TaxID=644 RepID=UPI003D20C445